MTDVIITNVEGGRTAGAPPSSTRRNWAWVGLVPFFAFLLLFLIIPALTVFFNALRTEDGFSLTALGDAISGQNWEAFKFSIMFSAGAALVGVIWGTLLQRRVPLPRWRSRRSKFRVPHRQRSPRRARCP